MENKDFFTQSELQELESLEIKGGVGGTDEATQFRCVNSVPGCGNGALQYECINDSTDCGRDLFEQNDCPSTNQYCL